LKQQKCDASSLALNKLKVIREVYDAALKRSIPRVVDDSAVIYLTKHALCGPTHFANGENRSIPININIPAGARPTYSGGDQRITWTIKGVLAVDGRPDKTTEICEIQVIAPTIQAQAVTVQKEIIRTVVMIPCKYCQSLMDQTLPVCPNCGAKRTV
jgi:hypothetical protein